METESLPTTYTCITCRVAFKDPEIQRQHYKTDWHRYNLKRKVAELPPVTAENFQTKVIEQRVEETAVSEQESCKVCHKTFNTTNQYENHLMSKKHRERSLKSEKIPPRDDAEYINTVSPGKLIHKAVSSVGSPDKDDEKASSLNVEVDSDVESVDSDDWVEDTDNPVKNNCCLFCKHHSRSIVKNLKHMNEAHGFFIPDPEYCIDVRGLLVYLGEKVFAGFMCLWCNDRGRVFQSAEAARGHMLDKGHCKMLHEGEALAEYSDWYDYSSSYPDAEDHDPDADVDIPEIDDTDYQLVLPSGNVIGHRSLMKYYKQNLDPNRAVAIPKNEKLRRVLCQYRAIGWSETQKVEVAKKVRDIRFMQRIQSRYLMKLKLKANKFQPHFRQQVNY
ncbi:cytoplasmic 60S subunit biogenesis factor ZNF622 [Microplitis demolitor]|uniref:cytoplasmic 60S subunit biogenesis factor ZNF622 n=1 Tax=Microplitis demolitor TaxID=69319 RepID=UPI0004CDCCC1|nr:cytoplasmic 60S subunit biogenesis factor ZNF622 [Microplitis demolitor]